MRPSNKKIVLLVQAVVLLADLAGPIPDPPKPAKPKRKPAHPRPQLEPATPPVTQLPDSGD